MSVIGMVRQTLFKWTSSYLSGSLFSAQLVHEFVKNHAIHDIALQIASKEFCFGVQNITTVS